MEWFSTTQRVLVAKTFYENEECSKRTAQKLRTISVKNEAPYCTQTNEKI